MKKNTHFIPSHEGTIISNEKLENMLLQAVCPGWNWLLYETTIMGKDGEQDSFFARFDHPAARLAYDITFSPEDPVRTLLEGLREMYDDYRRYYEDLGSCLDNVEATADLYNALCRAANVRDYPSPVGCVDTGEDGSTVIKRGKTTSGLLFKDWRAFYEHPDMPCYMPVLSDRVYTGNDFLALAGGDPQVAGLIFQTSSWGFPEAELEELVREGIILSCRKCRKLYLKEDKVMPCPECGEYPYDVFMKKISEDIQFIQDIRSGINKSQFLFGIQVEESELEQRLNAQAQALHLLVSEINAYGVNKNNIHRIAEDAKNAVNEEVEMYAMAYLNNNFGFLLEKEGETE